MSALLGTKITSIRAAAGELADWHHTCVDEQTVFQFYIYYRFYDICKIKQHLFNNFCTQELPSLVLHYVIPL